MLASRGVTCFAISRDGTRIAWDRTGSGPEVVLIHGLGSSRKRWDRLVPALADAGFSALRLDLRGFGESGPAPGPSGMSEMLDDVRALLEGAGLDRFHLIGHSLGGMISQRLTVEQPERVRSLVLASTTSHNGRRASAFARAMVLFSEHGFDRVLSDPELRPRIEPVLREAFPGIDPPLEMLRIGVEQPNAARANAWRACEGFSEKDRLGRVACPVLVLHGSADPLIPLRAGELVRDGIRQAEWIEVAGAGHSLPTERADLFNAAVLDFLARLAR
jgi:3-oxoadipate enol-lactonase